MSVCIAVQRNPIYTDRRKSQISIRIVALANGQIVTIVTFTTFAVKFFYIFCLVDARKHLHVMSH